MCIATLLLLLFAKYFKSLFILATTVVKVVFVVVVISFDILNVLIYIAFIFSIYVLIYIVVFYATFISILTFIFIALVLLTNYNYIFTVMISTVFILSPVPNPIFTKCNSISTASICIISSHHLRPIGICTIFILLSATSSSPPPSRPLSSSSFSSSLVSNTNLLSLSITLVIQIFLVVVTVFLFTTFNHSFYLHCTVLVSM